MNKEKIDLLKQGRFVVLNDNKTYVISTDNNFKTFVFVEMFNEYCPSYIYCDQDSYNNNFNYNEILSTHPKFYNINKIMNDVDGLDVIWERKIPILTKEEKNFLTSINNFYQDEVLNNVVYFRKMVDPRKDEREFIQVILQLQTKKGGSQEINLPPFSKNTKFKGMSLNVIYTLLELLEEEEKENENI